MKKKLIQWGLVSGLLISAWGVYSITSKTDNQVERLESDEVRSYDLTTQLDSAQKQAINEYLTHYWRLGFPNYQFQAEEHNWDQLLNYGVWNLIEQGQRYLIETEWINEQPYYAIHRDVFKQSLTPFIQLHLPYQTTTGMSEWFIQDDIYYRKEFLTQPERLEFVHVSTVTKENTGKLLMYFEVIKAKDPQNETYIKPIETWTPDMEAEVVGFGEATLMYNLNLETYQLSQFILE